MLLHYWRRLLIALLISSTCFFATVYWYNATAVKLVGTDNEPVALLKTQVNEVQRKPAARLIWESVSTGDNLFAGEAIRTTSTSEASIFFTDSGTVIDLEPDSLVIIEENKDEVSLDFLQGQLLVKQSGQDHSTLKIRSGKNTIGVDNSTLSLNKSASGDLDLEVFEGKAQVHNEGKTVTLDRTKSGTISQGGLKQRQRLQTLAPAPGSNLLIEPGKNQSIDFKWQKIDSSYSVYLEVGTHRKTLRRYKYSGSGDAGLLRASLKVGKFYWRLIAEPKKPGLERLVSTTVPIQIAALFPPTPLAPSDGDKIVVNAEQPKIQFRWASAESLESLFLEVAKDKTLKNKVFAQKLSTKLPFFEAQLEKEGQYFWRITGFIKDGSNYRAVSSRVQTFDLKIGVDLVPPKLKSPSPRQSLAYEQVLESGIHFTWAPIPGVNKYQLVVTAPTKARGLASEDQSVINEVVTSSFYRAERLPTGRYEWYVTSIDSKNKQSQPSEQRTFTIDAIPTINWASEDKYYFWTPEPQLELSWHPIKSEKVHHWRIRYALRGQLTENTQSKKVTRPMFTTGLDSPGKYDIIVEGIDAAGHAIARSELKTVEVLRLPLLPAPHFSNSASKLLTASPRGELSLSWSQVSGARQYAIEIHSLSGKLLSQKKFSRTQATLKRLKPGTYVVSLRSIDEHNRLGPASDTKKIEVPNQSDIQAPKLKQIKVK